MSRSSEPAARVTPAAFDATVIAVERVAPSVLRVTLQGPELEYLLPVGRDQRVKLVVPHETHGFTTFPRGGSDWYAAWRATPAAERCAMRTFPVHGQRPFTGEVDVDVEFERDAGAVTTWARGAAIGDRLVVVGPDARTTPLAPLDAAAAWLPEAADRALVAADGVALDAAQRLLDALPARTRGQVFVEVDDERDIRDLRVPRDVVVTWLLRSQRPHLERGTALATAVGAWASELCIDEASEADVAIGIRAAGVRIAAWIAGDAALVTRLDRTLAARGVPAGDVTRERYATPGLGD